MWFLAIVLIDFFRLRQFEDPSGADGYFYLKQIQSISEHAQFYYKDYSLAFLPPVVLNFIFHDPLFVYRLTTSLVAGAILWTTNRLALKLAPQTPKALRAALVIFLCVISLNTFYLQLCFVFLKTASAVLLFQIFLLCMLEERWRWAAVAAVGAILSHKLLAVFVPIALVSRFFPKHLSRKPVAFMILAVAVVTGVALVAHPALIAQFSNAFEKMNYDKFDFSTIYQKPNEFGALVLAFLLAGAAGFPAFRSEQSWAWVTVSIILLAPVLFPDGVDVNGISFRLLLLAFPFAAVTLVSLAQNKKNPTLKFSGYLFALIILVATIMVQPRFENLVPGWTKRIPETAELVRAVPADAMLYAPHGVEFYLAYKTAFRPRSFLIDPKGKPTYRVAYVAPYLKTGGAIADDIRQIEVGKLGEEFAVFRESDWNALGDAHSLVPFAMNLLLKKPDFVADY